MYLCRVFQSSRSNSSQVSEQEDPLLRSSSSSSSLPRGPAPQTLVRTDSRAATLDAYVVTATRKRALDSSSGSASQLDLSQLHSPTQSQSQSQSHSSINGTENNEENELEEGHTLPSAAATSQATTPTRTLVPLKKRRRPWESNIPKLTSVTRFLQRLDAEVCLHRHI